MRRTACAFALAALSLVLAPGCGGGGNPGGDGGVPGSDVPSAVTCSSGPLAAPIPNCMPDPLPSTGDLAEDCVRRINQFRWECQCLPPLGRWTGGEACADQQAEYDSMTREPHSGFRDGICDGGFGQNECPGWPSESATVEGCLQLMWDEGPGEPFSEHGHYINMSSTRFTEVACGFYTTPGGDVWAVQNFH